MARSTFNNYEINKHFWLILIFKMTKTECVQTGGVDLFVIESSVYDNCDLISLLVKVGKESCSPSQGNKRE